MPKRIEDMMRIRHWKNPSTTVGFKLSVSPERFCPSDKKPLLITVEARVLSTAYPDRPVTVARGTTALSGLSTYAFNDITRISLSDPVKKIRLRSKWRIRREPRPLDDLRPWNRFSTIPSQSSGLTYTITHEVSRDAIDEAGLVQGERYRVSLSDAYRFVQWVSFKSEAELESHRFAQWKGFDHVPTNISASRFALREEKMRERREELFTKYGDAPVEYSEDPAQVIIVAENEAEFEII